MLQRYRWLPIALAWGAVLMATIVGLRYARPDPAAWGTVLILGVTAAVAAWYAWETRRLGDETGSMAESNRDLARSTRAVAIQQLHSVLVVEAIKDPGTSLLTTCVVNEGPGTAVEVSILVGATAVGEYAERRTSRSQLLPGDSVEVPDAIHHHHIDVLWTDLSHALIAPKGPHFFQRWYFDDAKSEWTCDVPEEDGHPND